MNVQCCWPLAKINKSLKHDSWLVIVALTKQCITAAMLKGAVNPQNINVTLNTILNMKYNYLVQKYNMWCRILQFLYLASKNADRYTYINSKKS